MLARYLLEDVELHGTVAPRGSKLLLVPRLGQPRRAGLLRPRRLRHRPRQGRARADPVSFGGGRHFCLGAYLARLEARIALTRARRAGPLGRGRPRRPASGCTPSTCAASPPCRPGWRCADGARSSPTPTAAPPSSPAPRPASAPRRRSALAAAGYPVALGARRIDRLEEVAAQIRADGGEAVVHPLDLTDDDSVEAFAEAVAADLGDIEVVVSQRRRGRARARSPRSTPSGSPASSTSTWSARTGSCGRSCPAMVERRRGDIVFVSSDVGGAGRGPSWRRTSPASGASRAWSHALQMELEGTGVRASDRAARPDLERDGQRLGRRRRRRSCSTSGCGGASPGTRTS